MKRRLTADGRPLTEQDRQLIRDAFPVDAAGNGYCYACGRGRRLRGHALCWPCWNERSPFWRIAFAGQDLLTRAQLVVQLWDLRVAAGRETGDADA